MQHTSFRLHDSDRQWFDELCDQKRLSRADGFHLLVDGYRHSQQARSRENRHRKRVVLRQGCWRFWRWLVRHQWRLLAGLLLVWALGHFWQATTADQRYQAWHYGCAWFSERLMFGLSDPVSFQPAAAEAPRRVLPSELLADEAVRSVFQATRNRLLAELLQSGWLLAGWLALLWLCRGLVSGWRWLNPETRSGETARTPDDDSLL